MSDTAAGDGFNSLTDSIQGPFTPDPARHGTAWHGAVRRRFYDTGPYAARHRTVPDSACKTRSLTELASRRDGLGQLDERPGADVVLGGHLEQVRRAGVERDRLVLGVGGHALALPRPLGRLAPLHHVLLDDAAAVVLWRRPAQSHRRLRHLGHRQVLRSARLVYSVKSANKYNFQMNRTVSKNRI